MDATFIIRRVEQKKRIKVDTENVGHKIRINELELEILRIKEKIAKCKDDENLLFKLEDELLHAKKVLLDEETSFIKKKRTDAQESKRMKVMREEKELQAKYREKVIDKWSTRFFEWLNPVLQNIDPDDIPFNVKIPEDLEQALNLVDIDILMEHTISKINKNCVTDAEFKYRSYQPSGWVAFRGRFVGERPPDEYVPGYVTIDVIL
jgi:hypothetical protein